MEKKNKAVECGSCGKFFNEVFGICPFCGTELAEDNIELTDNQKSLLPATDLKEAFLEDIDSEFLLCPNCNNYYDKNVGSCAFCGFSTFGSNKGIFVLMNSNSNNEKSANENNTDKKPFVGTCEICDREAVLLRKFEIKDYLGVRYRNMCESCIVKYKNSQKPVKNNLSSKISSFFCQRKKEIIIATIIAIVLLLIIIISSNSGYTCSQCGEHFSEGYTVFGEPWCQDCFYG